MTSNIPPGWRKIEDNPHLYGYRSPILTTEDGVDYRLEVTRVESNVWDIFTITPNGKRALKCLYWGLRYQRAMRIARQEFEKRNGSK